jgi:hypothetical protein
MMRHQHTSGNDQTRRERGAPFATGEQVFRDEPKTGTVNAADARYGKHSQPDRNIVVNCKCGRGEIWVIFDLRDPRERESLERVHAGWEGSTIYRQGHFALLRVPSGGAMRLL